MKCSSYLEMDGRLRSHPITSTLRIKMSYNCKALSRNVTDPYSWVGHLQSSHVIPRGSLRIFELP